MQEQYDEATLKVTATPEYAVLADNKVLNPLLVLNLIIFISAKTYLPEDKVFSIVFNELSYKQERNRS